VCGAPAPDAQLGACHPTCKQMPGFSMEAPCSSQQKLLKGQHGVSGTWDKCVPAKLRLRMADLSHARMGGACHASGQFKVQDVDVDIGREVKFGKLASILDEQRVLTHSCWSRRTCLDRGILIFADYKVFRTLDLRTCTCSRAPSQCLQGCCCKQIGPPARH